MSVKNYSNTVDLEKMGIPAMKKDIEELKSTVEDFIIRCRNSSSTRLEVVDYTSIGEATTAAISAHDQGKEVYIKLENYLGVELFFKAYNITNSGLNVSMSNFYISGTNKYVNNKWTFTTTRTQKWQAATETDVALTLPVVASSDNGKLLQVVNGFWAAVDLDGNNDQF